MDFIELNRFLLSMKGATLDFPFDEEVHVYRVMNKIFALCKDEHPLMVNLKCDPDDAIELRRKYAAIEPGFHMNKKHWNTVMAGEDVSDELLKELVIHSYELIVNKLTKKEKLLLAEL